MKRAINLISALIGLMVLAMVAGLTFASRPSGQPGTQAVVTPITTLPAAGSVRFNPPQEVALPGVTRVGDYVLDGSHLLASIETASGFRLVVVDLASHAIHPVTSTAMTVTEMSIYGDYIAWVGRTATRYSDYRLSVVNWVTGHQVLARDAAYGGLGSVQFRDNLLLWGERHATGEGYYTLDLTTAMTTTVLDNRYVSWPKLCSREWLIFVQDVQQGTSGSLHARNINTGEETVLGTVPYPPEAGVGQQHACDGTHVAWLQPRPGNASGPEYHFADLASGSQRVLTGMAPPTEFLPRVLLSGDILLVGNAGYSLSLGSAFTALPDLPREQNYGGGGWVLSNDRLAWTSRPFENLPERLFTTTLVREP